jgi:hypothetical protein
VLQHRRRHGDVSSTHGPSKRAQQAGRIREGRQQQQGAGQGRWVLRGILSVGAIFWRAGTGKGPGHGARRRPHFLWLCGGREAAGRQGGWPGGQGAGGAVVGVGQGE